MKLFFFVVFLINSWTQAQKAGVFWGFEHQGPFSSKSCARGVDYDKEQLKRFIDQTKRSYPFHWISLQSCRPFQKIPLFAYNNYGEIEIEGLPNFKSAISELYFRGPHLEGNLYAQTVDYIEFSLSITLNPKHIPDSDPPQMKVLDLRFKKYSELVALIESFKMEDGIFDLKNFFIKLDVDSKTQEATYEFVKKIHKKHNTQSTFVLNFGWTVYYQGSPNVEHVPWGTHLEIGRIAPLK